MVEELFGGWAVLDLLVQHEGDYLLALGGYFLPHRPVKLDLRPENLPHQILIILPHKRRPPTNKLIERHPSRPYITLLIILLVNNLRRNIRRGANSILQKRPILNLFSNSEIYQLDYLLLFALKQEVLWLDVPVDDFLVVHVD